MVLPGSGSRNGNADLDPNPGTWKLIKIKNQPAFQKGFSSLVVIFLTFYLLKVHFHVKVQLLVTSKPSQDPDPHGFALVWIR